MSRTTPLCFKDMKYFRLLQVPLTTSLTNLEKACAHLDAAVKGKMQDIPADVMNDLRSWLKILREEKDGFFTANTSYQVDCSLRDLYDILNVDPHATQGEIYQAFKRTEFYAMYGEFSEHPAIQSFLEDIMSAYETLLDPRMRETYHRELYGEFIDGDTGKVVVTDLF